MTHTQVILADRLHDDLQKCLSDISKMSFSLNDGTGLLHARREVIPVTHMHRFLKLSRPESGIESVIYGMFAEAMIRAEMIGAGSSKIMGSLVSVLINRTRAGVPWAQIEHECADLADSCVKSSKMVSSHEFSSLVINNAGNYRETHIALEALKISGLSGRIFIEETKTSADIIVEKSIGYVFDIQTELGYDNWRVDNPLVLIIDGFIASVAEVHNLLDACSHSKRPLAIFARGFADDLKQTCIVNNRRGTLNANLFKVPYDLDNVNVLNDLAVVSKTDVVSSLKGQLISTLRCSDLAQIDQIIVEGKNLILLNGGSDRHVGSHIEMLRSKRAELSDPSVQEIYDQRIRSLSASNVKIYVPNRLSKSLEIEKIDYALRFARALLSRGIVAHDSLDTGQIFDSIVPTTEMPLVSWLAAISIGLKTMGLLNESSAAILLDV